MNCPSCQEIETCVIDSRLSKDGELIRRRRECEKCQHRFTTYERVEELLEDAHGITVALAAKMWTFVPAGTAPE